MKDVLGVVIVVLTKIDIMKKIITLLCLIVLTSSCAITNSIETSDPDIRVKKITFEEHDYILFQDYSRHVYGGVVHDPNCWCMVDCD